MVDSEISAGKRVDDERDELALLVEREKITSQCTRIDIRPDVSPEELALWQSQDPDYPLEHYKCVLRRKNKELEMFQTVGADYPDEDDEGPEIDLYRDNRDLLLSPEFLLESAALKANSVDNAANLLEWISNNYCETISPAETFVHYQAIRDNLLDLLGDRLYDRVVELALESENENDEEDEE